jgi:hypothetical protein
MTPTQLITTSLRHLGVLGSTETASGDDVGVMLGILTSMLDSWQVTPDAITGTDELIYTPTAGAQSFTIGPAGNIAATQPDRIKQGSFWRVNSVDTPLGIGTLDDYNSEASKSVTAQPLYVVLDKGYDTATVYLYPAADGLSQLHLVVASDVLAGYGTLGATTTLALPAGMQHAIEWSLAEQALSAYRSDAQTESRVVRNAMRARRKFGRSNAERSTLSTTEGKRYNIYTD